MQGFKGVIVALLALVVLAVYFSAYTVDETQTALKFRLGEVVETDIAPGLHFKIPFIQNVRKFDRRVQTLNEAPARFMTAEKKNVLVDTFVKWQVSDAGSFYTTVGGDPALANQRLSQIIRSGLRTEFGMRKIEDVISGDRREIMGALTAQATEAAVPLGIRIIDVRIQRLALPAEVNKSVYSRMVAERERAAKEFRARGAQEGEGIRAKADRQRTEILAVATRDAERIRGQGDAAAAEIYAKAYNRDREFYSFYRSLGVYRGSFANPDDVLILSPDGNDFFRYFERQRPQQR